MSKELTVNFTVSISDEEFNEVADLVYGKGEHTESETKKLLETMNDVLSNEFEFKYNDEFIDYTDEDFIDDIKDTMNIEEEEDDDFCE